MSDEDVVKCLEEQKGLCKVTNPNAATIIKEIVWNVRPEKFKLSASGKQNLIHEC